MTHDSRVNNKHEKATDITNNNWETIDAKFIAKILVSGIYLWEAAPTLDILKMQPQHSLALGLSNKELSIQYVSLWKDNSLYW